MTPGPDSVSLDTLMVVIRGVVLIIVAFAGVLSIYLGWKLFRDGIIPPADFEAKYKDNWTLKLTSVGPGIFFALFGMYLMIRLVGERLVMEDPVPAPAAAPASLVAAPQSFASLASAPQFAKAPPGKCVRQPVRRVTCLLVPRRRSFLDGEMTPDALRKAIDTALPILETYADGQVTPEQAAKVNDAIDVLTETRSSTGVWQLSE
jgi:hypothetical protein